MPVGSKYAKHFLEPVLCIEPKSWCAFFLLLIFSFNSMLLIIFVSSSFCVSAISLGMCWGEALSWYWLPIISSDPQTLKLFTSKKSEKEDSLHWSSLNLQRMFPADIYMLLCLCVCYGLRTVNLQEGNGREIEGHKKNHPNIYVYFFL